MTEGTSWVRTPEQRALRSSVRDFLGAKSPESEVRRLMETPPGYDPAVWRQMSDQLGLQALAIPEQYGGWGFSFTELGIVLEEQGRALLCAPFFSSAVLAAHALLRCEDEGAKHDYLPGIASGELIATVAVAEESGSWEPDGIRAAARFADGRWFLDGTKMYVTDGCAAELILIAAQAPEGLSLFAVHGDAEGLVRTEMPVLDPTRPQARIDMVDCPARLISRPGELWATIDAVRDIAFVATAAESVGGAQRCLDLSVEYAKTRVQFGTAIGKFQAIKHKCADMLLEIESARSVVQRAVHAAAEGSAERPVAACMAKTFAADAYFFVASQAIQIHGGIGFTWEHPAHLYFRRAKSTQVALLDPDRCRDLLVTRIGV